MTNTEKQIRTFIAVRLSDELRENLGAFANKFKKLPGNYRWISPDKMHLTLHFLGDVDEQLIPRIMKACQVAVREVPPFRLDFVGSGVFPNFKQPRVVWAGIKDENKTLHKLHSALGEQLAELGLKLESRSFSPHLTLARIKFSRQTGKLKQLTEKTRSEYIGSLDVRKITVFKSVLSPKGPEYAILGETYLKGD